MSPRAPEPRDHLLARLRRAAGRPVTTFMAVGHHHTTHAVCVEDGRLRLRRWTLDPAKGEAFLAAHGRFMPEDAEAISEPGAEILVDTDDVETLIARLEADGLV